MFIAITDQQRNRVIALQAGVVLCLTLVGAALLCRSSVAADAPAPVANPGDSTNEVVAKLGPPKGRMTRGRLTTYYYDRGLVDFIDGRVRTAFLITPEQVEQQREERERTEAVQRQQSEALRQQLTAEGERELLAHQADRMFARLPATNRLAYWQDFSRRYPYTNVSKEVAQAQAAAEAESNKQAQAAALQSFKDRFAAIQARLTQLESDYAASLTHWKRNEIDAERDQLKAERVTILSRIDDLLDQDDPSATKAQ